MQFDRCIYRPEIVAALRRTTPVCLTAGAFGFRGAGRSYSTSGATRSAGFRSDDRVNIRPLDGPDVAVSFDYTGWSRLQPSPIEMASPR